MGVPRGCGQLPHILFLLEEGFLEAEEVSGNRVSPAEQEDVILFHPPRKFCESLVVGPGKGLNSSEPQFSYLLKADKRASISSGSWEDFMKPCKTAHASPGVPAHLHDV